MEAATVSPPAPRGAPWRLRRCGDERLVARIREGDERCFEEAYDRYHRPLLAFCRHMLGSKEEAEDALQHVFISAHRQLLADDRPVQLKPWLYAIARNRCLSTIRDRRATVDLGAVAEPSTDGLVIAAEVERRQDLRDILGDLGSLPDDERAALVLAELGDLSHEDIAAALGVRRERVKALIFQARKSLIASRQARGADCEVVQEQLATLRGGALRRSSLRRHVALCGACASFEAEVGRQRAALGLILPVIPSVALKPGILASVLSSGTGAAATGVAGGAGAAGIVATGSGGLGGAGAGAAALGGSGLAAKVLAVVAVGAGALGGGVAVQRAVDRPAPVERRAHPAGVPTTSVERRSAPAPQPRTSSPCCGNDGARTFVRRAAAAAARERKARLKRLRAGDGRSRAAARSRAQAQAKRPRGASGTKAAGKPAPPGGTRPAPARDKATPATPAPRSRPQTVPGSSGGTVTGTLNGGTRSRKRTGQKRVPGPPRKRPTRDP